MRLWTAIRMVLVLTVLTGIVYPAVIAVLSRTIFPFQADGSLVVRDGRVVGSELIGQNFSSSAYFHPRPSAAGDKGYDATQSGGSNAGPTNRTFIETVKQRLQNVIERNGVTAAKVPVDLVTASGSGLDPEISPAAADIQVVRIASARHLSEQAVRAIVKEHTRPRWIGLFGEPGVNVLELNLALDAISGDLAARGKMAGKGGTE